jgi:hypothetical protein
MRIDDHKGRMHTSVSINAKGGYCWTIGFHLCQPLESDIGDQCQPLDKFIRYRDVDKIIGWLVIIGMIDITGKLVDVSRCDGYI